MLSGTDPSYLIKFYGEKSYENWESLVVSWISSSQGASHLMQTDSHIDDTNTGYLAEMEKLGASVLLMPDTDIHSAPYPDRLRPLNDYSVLKDARHILLVNLQFYAFSCLKQGSQYQNDEVYQALTDSLGTQNQALVQTRFLNTMPVLWQPNFFRPSFRINGNENVLKFYQKTAFGSGTNKGDLSIGELLPYELNIYHSVKNAITSIDVNAMAGQLVEVNGSAYIQRYAVMCRAYFTYVK